MGVLLLSGAYLHGPRNSMPTSESIEFAAFSWGDLAPTGSLRAAGLRRRLRTM